MTATVEKQVYSVNDIMVLLGIGRTKADELVNSNCFRTLKVGGQIIVTKRSFDLWLNGADEETTSVECAI